MTCLFCEMPEENYKPPRGVNFFCSRCVLAFLEAEQDYLQWVHDQAVKNSLTKKARAIESFLIPDEVTNESIKPEKHGRHLNRKRSLRPSANKKERIKQTKIREETPVL